MTESGFALVGPSGDDEQPRMLVRFNRATSRLISRVNAWVRPCSRRARRFYEESGWTLDGAIKVDDRDGYSLRDVRYSRKL